MCLNDDERLGNSNISVFSENSQANKMYELIFASEKGQKYK